MIELFKKELELCNVREGETVAVLSCGESLRHYARDFVAAAKSLGAKTVEVNLPGRSDGLKAIGKNELASTPKRWRSCAART